jgi:hypothetical protein
MRRFMRAVDEDTSSWGALATPTETKATIAQDAATGKPHVSQDSKGVVSAYILRAQPTCRARQTPDGTGVARDGVSRSTDITRRARGRLRDTVPARRDDRQGPAHVLGPLPAGPSWSRAHDCKCQPYVVRRCLTWTSWWRKMRVHVSAGRRRDMVRACLEQGRRCRRTNGQRRLSIWRQAARLRRCIHRNEVIRHWLGRAA